MSAKTRRFTVDQLAKDDKGAISIGPFGSRMKSECYVNNGVPVIRGTNIGDLPGLEGEFVYISTEMAESLGNCNVYYQDLVFPHRGSIGEVGIVDGLNDHFIISSSLMKLTCDQEIVNPWYLFFWFKTATGRHELLKNASQVGTPGSDLDNGPPSIHPDTPDHHEEAFVRRDLIGQSIRIACAKGLLHLDYQQTGIKYGLGMRGTMFLGAVHAVYVRKLRDRAAWLAQYFSVDVEGGPIQAVARIKPNHSHHFAYYGPTGGANL